MRKNRNITPSFKAGVPTVVLRLVMFRVWAYVIPIVKENVMPNIGIGVFKPISAFHLVVGLGINKSHPRI